ncbi:MAG: L,D-transpeptidase [Thermoleophilia bacterium]|nr:L,D-transpeptidase [Thermoleophilia bacterium]
MRPLTTFDSSHRFSRKLISGIAVLTGIVALTAGTATATAASSATPPVAKSKVAIKPFGLKHGKAKIMDKVAVGGNVRPFRANQRVRVYFFHNGHKYHSRSVKLKRGKGNYGTFRTSLITKKGGKYAVQAKYFGKRGNDPVGRDSTERKSWGVRYVAIGQGFCGRIVKGFRKALNRLHLVPSQGKCFDGQMDRAVLAYRKLNDYARNSRASKGIVKRIFNRKGGYHVRRPGLGNHGIHVEAPLSKQVLVFAKKGKPTAIFPIASGKSSTPTILGTFSFYMKDAGYNSHGMYYSSYFIRGYATHGYADVPDYPASHGCLRTFIADQPRIYNMTKIGMPIYVFGNAFRSADPFSRELPGGGNGVDLGPTGGLDPAAPHSAD